MRSAASRHGVCRIEAVDQGSAIEKLLVQLAVLGNAPQLVEMLAPDRRVLFLHGALVLNGLHLHVIDLCLTSLTGIAVEHARFRSRKPYGGELVGQVDRIMDAPVEAHAADRIVDM